MEKIKNHFSERWYMYVMGILIVAMIYFYGKITDYEENNINEINSVYYMTQLNVEDIIGVTSFNKMGQELSFTKKEDDTWVYTADESLAIEQAGPQYLAELLNEIATEYLVEDAEDISIYGLSDKCPYVEIETAEKDYRIYIGDYNDTVKRYYAYLEGENDVYGVQVNVAEVLDFTLEDYLLKE